MFISKSRLVTGCSLISFFALIVIFGKEEHILLLLMLIPTKVFQELRRIHLTSTVAVQQQMISDWALFTVSLCCVFSVIWFDIQKLYYCFLSYLGWFSLWVIFILNGNSNNSQKLSSCLLHAFWIHMAIVYTLVQPILINANISNGGLFWFIFPCSLVFCNDIAAYFCGKYFGRHKLLDLSPNKTLEGYIGAIFVTTFFSLSFAPWLYQFSSLVKSGFEDIEAHAIHFALFASVFAPFGGFFASALKRACQMKDFGSLLPGHGGFTDRVDCHLFMALFTFLYYNAFVMKTAAV